MLVCLWTVCNIHRHDIIYVRYDVASPPFFKYVAATNNLFLASQNGDYISGTHEK